MLLDYDVPCPENCLGLRVAEYLAETRFPGRVVIHSANPLGATSMRDILLSAGIVVAVVEFGSFYLNEEPQPVFDLGELDDSL